MIIYVLSQTERLRTKFALLADRAGTEHRVVLLRTIEEARSVFTDACLQPLLVDISTDTSAMMVIAKTLREEAEQAGKPYRQCIAGSLSVEPAMIQETRLHHIDIIVPMYKFEEIIKHLLETL